MIDLKEFEKKAVDQPTSELGGPLSGYMNYKNNLIHRGFDPALIDQALELNDQRKKKVTQFESLKSQQNKMNQVIVTMKKEGQDLSIKMKQLQTLSSEAKILSEELSAIEIQLKDLLLTLPNLCHPSVPIGKSAGDNQIMKVVGKPVELSFKAKLHWELGEKLGLIDFDRAGKVAGSRFAFLTGALAYLERALVQMMLDIHTREHGYIEMVPPYMVNSASLVGTAQFPKFYEDVFHLKGMDLHLIPTAEVPVTNYFAGEILREEQLPVCFVAFSPCFRAEAGSYGRDTKGLIRQHQFHKVELVKIVTPEFSYDEHEKLTLHAETILERLELPYRRVSLCCADIGFGATKCYDLEVWLPGQQEYREISSCSHFETFQARRANIRYRPLDPKNGKIRYVHTLNGSGLAVGRTLIAILENYQTKEGSVQIPPALQPYMGGIKVISHVP